MRLLGAAAGESRLLGDPAVAGMRAAPDLVFSVQGLVFGGLGLGFGVQCVVCSVQC